MTLSRRSIIIVAIASLTMVFLTTWAFDYLDEQRSAAAGMAQELATCRALASQINAARLTTTDAPHPAEMTSAIARAASNSGITPGSLERIDPGPISRDGALAERQIDLSIRQATMEQLVKFLHSAAIPPLGLRTGRLRLTPSQSASGGWAAEITLTYPMADDLKE